MVIGKNTNTVYLSELLYSDDRFNSCCNTLIKLLSKYGITHKFIKETKDIWCRDYMPIQIEKKQFVQFRYEPSYLKNDLHLQSDPRLVCLSNDLNPKFSKINLDGGNIVNWSDRAIVTDRIFDENPEFTNRAKLISEIESLLSAELIVIPQIKSDMTGHADGLVRFVDRNTILGNDRNSEYKYWSSKINNILKYHSIEYIDVPFLDLRIKNLPDHAIGCYVNYLEVKDLIVIPVFEIEENRDDEVIKQFQQIFPSRQIEAINYNEIGLHGGLLNCTTWTVQE